MKKEFIPNFEMELDEWEWLESRYDSNRIGKSRRVVIMEGLHELKDIIEKRKKAREQYERRKARKQKEGL